MKHTEHEREGGRLSNWSAGVTMATSELSFSSRSLFFVRVNIRVFHEQLLIRAGILAKQRYVCCARHVEHPSNEKPKTAPLFFLPHFRVSWRGERECVCVWEREYLLFLTFIGHSPSRQWQNSSGGAVDFSLFPAGDGRVDLSIAFREKCSVVHKLVEFINHVCGAVEPSLTSRFTVVDYTNIWKVIQGLFVVIYRFNKFGACVFHVWGAFARNYVWRVARACSHEILLSGLSTRSLCCECIVIHVARQNLKILNQRSLKNLWERIVHFSNLTIFVHCTTKTKSSATVDNFISVPRTFNCLGGTRTTRSF